MANTKATEIKNIQKQHNALIYKDKPLVRHDNVLYYGFPSDKYIIKMEIVEPKTETSDTSNKVIVELLDISGKFEKMIKKSERTGLYGALEIGSIWLDRSLSENKSIKK